MLLKKKFRRKEIFKLGRVFNHELLKIVRCQEFYLILPNIMTVYETKIFH